MNAHYVIKLVPNNSITFIIFGCIFMVGHSLLFRRRKFPGVGRHRRRLGRPRGQIRAGPLNGGRDVLGRLRTARLSMDNRPLRSSRRQQLHGLGPPAKA